MTAMTGTIMSLHLPNSGLNGLKCHYLLIYSHLGHCHGQQSQTIPAKPVSGQQTGRLTGEPGQGQQNCSTQKGFVSFFFTPYRCDNTQSIHTLISRNGVLSQHGSETCISFGLRCRSGLEKPQVAACKGKYLIRTVICSKLEDRKCTEPVLDLRRRQMLSKTVQIFYQSPMIRHCKREPAIFKAEFQDNKKVEELQNEATPQPSQPARVPRAPPKDS